MDSANFTFPPGFDINKPFDYCTELTSFCRIELTTLGYRPSLGFNYFFAVAFFLAGLANITLGISRGNENAPGPTLSSSPRAVSSKLQAMPAASPWPTTPGTATRLRYL